MSYQVNPTTGELDIVGAAGAGGSTVIAQDEGSTIDAAATTLNFVGSGVTATVASHVVTITVPGGSGLSPSYHLTDYAATTTYSGINSVSSLTTNANWALTKTVLSGNNRDVRTVYTATDQWANRATATYTTSLAYSN